MISRLVHVILKGTPDGTESQLPTVLGFSPFPAHAPHSLTCVSQYQLLGKLSASNACLSISVWGTPRSHVPSNDRLFTNHTMNALAHMTCSRGAAISLLKVEPYPPKLIPLA